MAPCRKNKRGGGSSRELQKAVELSKQFHEFEPRRIRQLDVEWPRALVLIGACAKLEYVSDKFDNVLRLYFHEFENPCVVMAGASPQKDGSNLLIIHGHFEITSEGIIG